MTEKPEGLELWRKFQANVNRLGLQDIDFHTYQARRAEFSESENRRLDESFEAIARDFAEQHFLLFKNTVLQWSRDPRTTRILADPKLKEMPSGKQFGPILHACNHIGEEVRARAAAGEVVPHAILLGIGVIMGWTARSLASRLGTKDYVSKGGRVGPAPKIDAETQHQLWLWKREGASLNVMLRRLGARGITITKAGIKKAIEREERLRTTGQALSVN